MTVRFRVYFDVRTYCEMAFLVPYFPNIGMYMRLELNVGVTWIYFNWPDWSWKDKCIRTWATSKSSWKPTSRAPCGWRRRLQDGIQRMLDACWAGIRTIDTSDINRQLRVYKITINELTVPWLRPYRDVDEIWSVNLSAEYIRTWNIPSIVRLKTNDQWDCKILKIKRYERTHQWLSKLPQMLNVDDIWWKLRGYTLSGQGIYSPFYEGAWARSNKNLWMAKVSQSGGLMTEIYHIQYEM